ncbi:DUF4382 domain-containing protein [Sulfurovum sp. AR]|uniref:DUF4382 domain-containing protein n=1 Tax=Sulfurovum sp. AR TaxID=1165841 RepID=UPI00025C4B9B|nr:DUF4382 domain-containing protein [Sulfurovum sp. AR]EIF51310.1 hypothetical protein SULAR_03652 [Sulfurovum sp. AR]
MKRFNTLIGIILSFILMTLISGCGGGGTSSDATTGIVNMRLTDAPIDDETVEGVYVTFTALRYQYKDSNEGWQDVDLNESRTINLLALQEGNTTMLNRVELPAGEISHVRFDLNISNCYITFNDGSPTQMLTMASEEQTGYKSTNGFVIAAGGTTNITADFDVRKSVTIAKNGKTQTSEYKLNPTIRLIDNMEVGEINGTMTLDANVSSKVIVYAYEDETFDSNESNTTNNFGNAIVSTDATDGDYTLPWLATGVYDLVVVEIDNLGDFVTILGYINNVPVNVDETTVRDITDATLEDTLL